jgi:hypothetical protein
MHPRPTTLCMQNLTDWPGTPAFTRQMKAYSFGSLITQWCVAVLLWLVCTGTTQRLLRLCPMHHAGLSSSALRSALTPHSSQCS